MNQTEWENCEDPKAMVQFLRHGEVEYICIKRPTERKLKLWLEACQSLVPSHMIDGWGEIVGINADVRVWCGVNAWMKECPLSVRADLLREIFGNSFKPFPSFWAQFGGFAGEERLPGVILTWRNGLIRSTAEQIYNESKWEDTPILADMLEDAGCADKEILSHLCNGVKLGIHFGHELRCNECSISWEPCERNKQVVEHPIRHCRGCWVIDLLTGQE